MISQILPDDFDNLWLGSNRGLMRVDDRPADGQAHAEAASVLKKMAGVKVVEVNQLIKQFEQMQKMMKMMKGGNQKKLMRQMEQMRGKGGMGGLPGF